MTMINNHFAIRLCRWDSNQQPSGKPDGMFLRNDGYCTDSKVSAKVFTSEQEAESWFKQISDPSNPTRPGWLFYTSNPEVYIVPVVTKTVIKQALTAPTRRLI